MHKHGAAAFAWLNSKAPSSMQSVLTADGTVASATSDMLNSILHMLGRPSFILENSLMLLMFQSIPCSIPNLSGADLKDKINATKSSRAVALDGWRIPEVFFLPTEWYDLVAQCLALMENNVAWPDVCCLGMISTIPKGVENNLDDLANGALG